MSELISRQAALESLETDCSLIMFDSYGNLTFTGERIIEAINRVPSVEQERKTGKWINVASGSLIDKYICSECKKEPCQKKIDITWGWDFTDYCPHCGADMREVQDEIRDQ